MILLLLQKQQQRQQRRIQRLHLFLCITIICFLPHIVGSFALSRKRYFAAVQDHSHRPWVSFRRYCGAVPREDENKDTKRQNHQQKEQYYKQNKTTDFITQTLSSMNPTMHTYYTPITDQFGLPAWQDISENRFIRIDSEIVQNATITTPEQVWERIHQIRSIQDKYGSSRLLSRTWMPTTSTKDPAADDSTFSVAQFNALAEGLSVGPNVMTPFLPECAEDECSKIQNDNYVGAFGGFTSIPHPEIVLDFELRKWRLLEVLLTSGYDNSTSSTTTTKPCDILAMEEIDRYHGFFAPMLRLFGYHGAFAPKQKSPGVSMGWYSDGCALFWNDQLFQLISQRHHRYSLGNQVALHVVLRHRTSGKSVVVIVTHLKSKCNTINENIRMQQIQELLVQVDETVQSAVSNDGNHDADASHMPVLLSGDFNTEPPATRRDTSSALNQLLIATATCFQSLYPLDSSTLYTTWKIRGSLTVKRVIDYIFYRGSLQPLAMLGVPDETDLEPTKLPGLRYPSDHVLIAGRFHLQ